MSYYGDLPKCKRHCGNYTANLGQVCKDCLDADRQLDVLMRAVEQQHKYQSPRKRPVQSRLFSHG